WPSAAPRNCHRPRPRRPRGSRETATGPPAGADRRPRPERTPGMPHPRVEVCESASRKLAQRASDLAGTRALIGLDGFVDEIIAGVDKGHGAARCEPVRTIAAMADKIRAAAGESSNYELIVTRRKLGGNGPIMANALACIGLGVTYIGNLGYPDIHPVFREFASRARVISIAEPGHTDALEFEDGKLMLGKHESLHEVNLENLLARVGRDELQGLVQGATLLGMVNWTMLPRMREIWEHLTEWVFPKLEGGRKTLFIDLADPEMRTQDDIRGALRQLARFQERVDVIFGLNLKEAEEITEVLGLPIRSDYEEVLDIYASACTRC